MKKNFTIFIFLLSFTFSYGQKVIFLHHSTGSGVYLAGNVPQWFSNYNAQHGTNYQVSDKNYPNTPYPWANYPYDYWNLWINNQCNNSNPTIECMDNIAQNYDVIIFKHCFLGSSIWADDGNPSISSYTQTLANYKLQYRALRSLMDSYPTKKFIVWTLVPLHRLATNTENAARARQFVDWVKTSWLTEDAAPHPNIYIFDFFGLAAESNATPPFGQLNCLKYDYEQSHTDFDSHPNLLANQTVGPIFAQFIVNTINDTPDPGDLTAPSVPTGFQVTSTSVSSIGLSWSASTDNVGVTGYLVYRGGVLLNTTAGLTYTDNAISSGNIYTYTVSAIDAAGNSSPQSLGVSVNTNVLTAPVATLSQPTCVSSTGTIQITSPTGLGIEYSINGGTNWVTGTLFSGLTASTNYSISARNKSFIPGNVLTTNFAINALPVPPPAPVVSNSSPLNVCPVTLINLTSLVTNSTPTGGSIFFKTSNNPLGINVSNPLAVGSGSYYIFYQNQEGCYSSGTLVTVTINNCPPDVTPTIIASPNIMHGISNFNLTVKVTELNMVNTNGKITVNIPKDARWTMTDGFVQSLSVIGTTQLNNSDWAYSSDDINHIFTTETIIPAGGFSIFGFKVTFSPGNSRGVYSMFSNIISASGGEVHLNNNSDSEMIDFFQQ